MKKIKAIFFDVGNTLALLDEAFLATLAADYGVAVDVGFLRRVDLQVRFTMDLELLRQIESGQEIGQGVVSMCATGFLRRYLSTLLEGVGVAREHHDEFIDRLFVKDRAHPLGIWNRLEPDTEPTLARLRESGYILGVITNSDGRAAAKLEHLRLAGFFDLVVDSAVVGVEKPHVRIFELALEHFGLGPYQSLYVGDLYAVDVLGARRAAMHAALYDPAGLYPEIDPGALRSLSEIPALVKRSG